MGGLWLFGDSHALRISKGLDAATRGMKLFLGSSGIVMLQLADEHTNQTVAAYMYGLEKNLQEGDLVVVIYAASRFEVYVDGGQGWLPTKSEALAAAAMYEAWLRDFQALADSRGAKLIMFADWQTIPHP